MTWRASLGGLTTAVAACGEPHASEPAVPGVVSVSVSISAATESPPPVSATVVRPPPREPPVEPVGVLQHRPCDVQGPAARPVDLNKDGKPDMIKVMDGGREVCRAMDFDFDGMPDQYDYFAPDQSRERIERDTNGDGQIDHVVYRPVPSATHCVELMDRNGDGQADHVERILDCTTKLPSGP